MTNAKRVSTAADLARVLPSIRWLWQGWLPLGFVTLLVGIPGVGKSMSALEIAKCVIKPADWPDGSRGPSKAEEVLWCDCEAAQAVLNERITNWNLPAERILLPGGDPLASVSLSKEKDRSNLVRLVDDFSPAMVVVDSLGAAHAGDENSTRDMGIVLGFLAKLARDRNIAVLVVHHLRKRGVGEDREINLDRVRGSSVITSFSRVVMALERVGDGIRLSVAKSNLAKLPGPLGLTIGDAGIDFGNAPMPEPTLEEKAAAWLRDAIKGNPMPFKELEPLAKGEGISKRQLYKARDLLNVITVDNLWKLPEDDLLEILGK